MITPRVEEYKCELNVNIETNLLPFKQASLIARASKGPFENSVTASRLFYYDIRVYTCYQK